MNSTSALDSSDLSTPTPSQQPTRADAVDRRASHLSAKEAMSMGRNLKGKHVIITGASSGFGRAFAIKAAGFGARVVVSDLNVVGIQAVGAKIKALGGTAAVYPKSCDTADWDTQLDMFEFARKTFGHIDIVIPNAGVSEMSQFMQDEKLDAGGHLKRESMLTIDVNLIGALYTIRIGFHHLKQNPAKEGKAIVFVGSIYSANSLAKGPLYATAKHGIYSLFKSMYWDCQEAGINTNIIAPWFVDTGIVSPLARTVLFGLPFATVSDVVASIIKCCADPSFTGNHVVVDPEGLLSFPFACPPIGPENGYYAESYARSNSQTSLTYKLRDVRLITQAALKSWMPKSSLGQLALAIAVVSLIRRRLTNGRAP